MVVFKNRYMVFEFLWQGKQPPLESLTQGTLSSAIQESLLINFGELGLGSCITSLQVKYLNPITSVCIVRCSRNEFRKVWAAVTFITSFRKQTVVFNLLHLSGSIRACRTKALEYDKEKLRLSQLVPGGELDPAMVEAAETVMIERISSMER